MDAFEDFPHSDFDVVSPEGKVRSSGSGIFTGNQVTVFDENLLIFTDDEIRRTIPNGAEETFTVVDPAFFSEMAGLPGHFQIEVRKKGTFPHHHGGYYTINVSGENARVNLHSTDNSTNSVHHSGVFSSLISAIEASVDDGSQRAILVDGVRDMEKARGSGDFVSAYSKFVGAAANHIAVITPFLPALSSYLTGG